MNSKLRGFRQLHGLTQKEAAKLFGLTQGAWSNYECKRKGIALKTYLQLRDTAEKKGLLGFPDIETFA